MSRTNFLKAISRELKGQVNCTEEEQQVDLTKHQGASN